MVIDDEPQFIGADTAAAFLRFGVDFCAGGVEFGVEDLAMGAELAVVAADAVEVERGVVLGAWPAGLFSLVVGEAGGGAIATERVVKGEVVWHVCDWM